MEQRHSLAVEHVAVTRAYVEINFYSLQVLKKSRIGLTGKERVVRASKKISSRTWARYSATLCDTCVPNPQFVEWMMRYPPDWTRVVAVQM